MGHIACIGSRSLTAHQTETCEKIGAWVVKQGHRLHTGNAQGADQAYARGANTVNPDEVTLHLPWPKYERQAAHQNNDVRPLEENDRDAIAHFFALAKKHHPVWERLSQGAQKLMARNSSILLPYYRYGSSGELICDPVDLVIALPSDKPGGGGTGQGMRIAESMGIEVINIAYANKQTLYMLCEQIRRMS